MGETYRGPASGAGGGGTAGTAAARTSGAVARTSGAVARPLRVMCVSERDAETSVLRAALDTILPGASVESAAPSILRHAPTGDVIVVESDGGGHGALEWLRQIRARGFAGSTLLVADEPAPEVEAAARQLGAPALALGEVTTRFLDALQAASVGTPAGADPGADEARRAALVALRRSQQLIAAGQIALRLQHSLNNPLTGLLAEAQLLEMEETLAPDHLEAVQRIVELCRRTIAVARALDGVSAPMPAARGDG